MYNHKNRTAQISLPGINNKTRHSEHNLQTLATPGLGKIQPHGTGKSSEYVAQISHLQDTTKIKNRKLRRRSSRE
jgi:hypothetical protein